MDQQPVQPAWGLYGHALALTGTFDKEGDQVLLIQVLYSKGYFIFY